MPLIEELPVTNPTRVSHGWAYVPDVSAKPITSMAQPNSRKRQRHDIGTTNATATAKQQKAIQQRLESLGRENWKDGVSVPIPNRLSGKERKTKMTTNVRRILNYQKGFMHYLADEEAAAANGTSTVGGLGPSPISATTTTHGAPATTSGAARGEGKRKAITATTAPEPSSGSSRRRSTATTITTTVIPAVPEKVKRKPGRPSKASKLKEEAERNEAKAILDNATATPTTTQPDPDPAAKITSSTPQAPVPPKPKPPYDPSYDTNPLLRTLNLPKKPSARVLELLTSSPALSYTAARAKPLAPIDLPDTSGSTSVNPAMSTSKLKAMPARHFCAVCGYWGKVKCRKCGEWTCGLMDCWKGHEAVCVALGMY